MKKPASGTRTLLVINGDKKFKVTIPTSAKLTFGPWAPPNKSGDWGERKERASGTLRRKVSALASNLTQARCIMRCT